MELLGRINEKLKARLSSCDELRFRKRIDDFPKSLEESST